MGWLIDTSLWVAVERGALAAADIHAITRQDPVYLSPVNVAEIRFGAEMLRPGPQKQRATAMLRRLRRKPQLRITIETSETFGTLAAKLKKAGRDPYVRVNDLWLAAQAIQRDFRLRAQLWSKASRVLFTVDHSARVVRVVHVRRWRQATADRR